jgi:predicted dithiol-disulfide oxidoreductase (DUF899 family)
MGKIFPGESAEYREARHRLLQQEIELRRATEAVAEARRTLPAGGVVKEDYEFEEAGPDGLPRKVRLSELFSPGKDTLLIYNFMYGPEMESACPSCTSILDALDGEVKHITQRVNFAVVAKSPVTRVLSHATDRGWHQLRLLSSAGNTYNLDYFGETEDGSQVPMWNVFRRDNGTIRHFWGTEMLFAPADPGQDPHHVDSIWPLWNVLDVTPEGRGADWGPQLDYR